MWSLCGKFLRQRQLDQKSGTFVLAFRLCPDATAFVRRDKLAGDVEAEAGAENVGFRRIHGAGEFLEDGYVL